MIIPIKCFTCGNVLANKYRYYQQEVLKMKTDNVKSLPESEQYDAFRMIYLTKNNAKKTPEGIVLDNLGLKNVCCRRHMLTHVDIQ
jgi:DNA-directed RNA polymerase subunit N (RpoN/RPB10)